MKEELVYLLNKVQYFGTWYSCSAAVSEGRPFITLLSYANMNLPERLSRIEPSLAHTNSSRSSRALCNESEIRQQIALLLVFLRRPSLLECLDSFYRSCPSLTSSWPPRDLVPPLAFVSAQTECRYQACRIAQGLPPYPRRQALRG